MVTVLFRPYFLFITNGAFAHPAYFSVLDPGGWMSVWFLALLLD